MSSYAELATRLNIIRERVGNTDQVEAAIEAGKAGDLEGAVALVESMELRLKEIEREKALRNRLKTVLADTAEVTEIELLLVKFGVDVAEKELARLEDRALRLKVAADEPVTFRRYRGDFEEGRLYEPGDVIRFQAALWIALKPTRERPPSPSWEQLTHTSDFFLAGGGQGPQGIQGPPGPQGPPGAASVGVEDDGVEVLASISGLDFGSGLVVVDNGDNTVTVNAVDIGEPVLPQSSFGTASSLSPGISSNIDGDDITAGQTGQLAMVRVSSSVPVKAEIQTVAGITTTTHDTVFTSEAKPSETWFPPHKEWLELAGGAGQFFRVRVTSLDTSDTADVYAAIYWDEVP